MDDYDVCYECSGYGDDYFINDDGELECYCPQCPFNAVGWDDDWNDDWEWEDEDDDDDWEWDDD